MVSYRNDCRQLCNSFRVLILVVVDDGLVRGFHVSTGIEIVRLNPCCSGRWSRTRIILNHKEIDGIVLILVVVDDGLVLLVHS